jgi:hypothetical protein
MSHTGQTRPFGDIAAQPTLTVHRTVHVAKLGFNYRFWDMSPAGDPEERSAGARGASAIAAFNHLLQTYVITGGY